MFFFLQRHPNTWPTRHGSPWAVWLAVQALQIGKTKLLLPNPELRLGFGHATTSIVEIHITLKWYDTGHSTFSQRYLLKEITRLNAIDSYWSTKALFGEDGTPSWRSLAGIQQILSYQGPLASAVERGSIMISSKGNSDHTHAEIN